MQSSGLIAQGVQPEGTERNIAEHIRISYATSVKELDRGLSRIRAFIAGLS
jgi:hypothetical protein